MVKKDCFVSSAVVTPVDYQVGYNARLEETIRQAVASRNIGQDSGELDCTRVQCLQRRTSRAGTASPDRSTL